MQKYIFNKKITVLTFFNLLILTNTIFAATYYVDHTLGNDLNAGTQASPWAHSPGMPSWTGTAVLVPGDMVYFDRGDTWTETGHSVLSLIGGVSYIGDAWGTGTRAKLVAGSDLGWGNVVHFFADHPTYPTVLKGFDIDAGGANATASCPRSGAHYANNGISMNYQARGWGSYALVPLIGTTKRIQNCVVHDTWSCTAASEYFYGLVVRSDWEQYGPPYTGKYVENVEILDSIIYNQSRTAITIYPHWDSNGNYVKNVLVRGNETYNTGQDPGYGAGYGMVLKDHIENVTIEYNYFHGDNGPGGATFNISSDVPSGTGPTGITFRYNILGTTSGEQVRIAHSGTKQMDFYGNIILTDYDVNVVSDNVQTLNLRFYNNTFYRGGLNIQSNSATNTIEVRNNIFYGNGGALLADPSGYIGVNHNNNIYYRADGGTLVSSGGSSYTSANLNSYESSAISNNPLFVNTANLPTGFTGTHGLDKRPNFDGLSLQISSPGIDTGVNLGIPFNSSINSINRPSGSGSDRGAYEIGILNMARPSSPLNLRIN